MIGPFTAAEQARIGWGVADAWRSRQTGKCCHYCRHYCYREDERTEAGIGGFYGHLVPCCRAVEDTGGSVRTTNAYSSCNLWELRQ